MRKSPLNAIMAYTIKHPVLANLLMCITLFMGFFAATRMPRQALPDFKILTAVVDVRWPAASAKDVQGSVTVPIENKLFGLDGMLSMRSTSSQSSAVVIMEFANGTDMDRRLQDIRDRIATIRFPEDVETPRTFQPLTRERTLSLLLHGPEDLNQLRRFTYQSRRELLGMGADDVEIQGVPRQELAVEISQNTMHGLGLSLTEVARQLRAKSRSIPLGDLGKGGVEEERSIKGKEQLTEAYQFDALYLNNALGGVFRLGGYADVRLQDRFNEPLVFFNDKPAVNLNVYRVLGSGNDSFDLRDLVNRWKDKVGAAWPGVNISMETYGEAWKLIAERLELMAKNGALGFLCIFLILIVFLHFRVAFWVAMGVPIAVAGALFFLYTQGGTLNFLSTFGFLMAFGIIVDDTIVVSEQAYSEYQRGKSPKEAALNAANMMLSPILASSVTTIAAFMPLLIMQGLFGKILKDIPTVVIVVILASLVECFLILPHHLQGALQSIGKRSSAMREKLNRGIAWVQYTWFRKVVTWAVHHAGVTIVLSLSLVAIPFMLLSAGRLKFRFFPSPPSDILFMDADFYPGTPNRVLGNFLQKANRDLMQAEASLGAETPKVVLTPIQLMSYRSPEGGALAIGTGVVDAHAAMVVAATAPDAREVQNPAFLSLWRERLMQNTPSQLIDFSVSEPKSGPPGADIRLLVKGIDVHVIKEASETLKRALRQFKALNNVKDSLTYGRAEYVLTLKPLAQSLGVSKADLSGQLSAGLYGSEVQENAEFGETVRVVVRLDRSDQLYADMLKHFPIKTPSGQMLPLSDLASSTLQPSFVRYQQYNGALYSEVSADILPGQGNLGDLLQVIQQRIVPEIMQRYAVTISDEEQSRYETEAVEELKYGAVVGLLMIYLVLAWVSRSYVWPGVVMLVIPFGLSGAFAGHYLLNMSVTLLSIFGLFGLTGIVINNAIILLHRYHAICAERPDLTKVEAVIEASCQRVRAVFLTTVTTIIGLAPLLLETSLQAAFLQPMAVSISFGLGFATILILLVLPTIMALFVGGKSKSS